MSNSHPLPISSLYDTSPSTSLVDQILGPANRLLFDYIRGVYRDGSFDDPKFIRFGVLRVLSQSVSGRDFLQSRRDSFADPVARSSFFDSLHSSRRSKLLDELNTQLVQRLSGGVEDLLGRFPELRSRRIFAVDGHHIAHAVHSPRDPKGEFVSANSLYVLCLHSGLLMNLGAVQGDGVHRHEMPVFRHKIVDWLQRHAGRRSGHKPILVADPAFVDKVFWMRMDLFAKHGAHVILRTKTNMDPTVYGSRHWDRNAPVNQGVTADEAVGFDGASTMRRIRYTDPESGNEYEFLTSVMDLAPGLIALIYLLRWRIEKLFDTGKNKLEETKAWAVGPVAQEVQAHFFALTHNLLVLLRRELELSHGIREEKVEKKREQTLEKRQQRAKKAGGRVPAIQFKLPAIVQMTAQFIRALRNGILAKMRWCAALELLRAATKSYL